MPGIKKEKRKEGDLTVAKLAIKNLCHHAKAVRAFRKYDGDPPQKGGTLYPKVEREVRALHTAMTTMSIAIDFAVTAQLEARGASEGRAPTTATTKEAAAAPKPAAPFKKATPYTVNDKAKTPRPYHETAKGCKKGDACDYFHKKK